MSSASAVQKSLANYDAVILTEKDVEKIDALVIDAVFGYIRKIESSLCRKRIPTEVALICLSYYYFDDNEYFANVHSDYKTTNSANVIRVVQTACDSDCSAFGNVLIPSQFGGVYTWEFNLYRDSPMLEMSIGITTEYEDTDVGFSWGKKGHNYSIDEEGTLCKNGNEICSHFGMSESFEKYGFVTMTLDLNQRTLTYEYNYQDEAIEDIICGSGINYKMAVSAFHKSYNGHTNSPDNEIRLMEFCIKD